MELQNLPTEISDMISMRKEEYVHLSKKLNNPSIRSKSYWFSLKCFYNGNKAPLIPALLVKNKFVLDFTEKLTLLMFFTLINVHLSLIIVFYLLVNTL